VSSGTSVDELDSEFLDNHVLTLEGVDEDIDYAYIEPGEADLLYSAEAPQSLQDEELSEVPSSPSSATTYFASTLPDSIRPSTPLRGDGTRGGPEASRDLLPLIPAMYRILELVSERSSGGLG
jgi:hypothetical protein